MAVEETTEQGWLSRIGDAIKGVVVGIVMIPLCMYLLWWNEGRSVRRYATIGEARSNCVETAADKIDSATEGKLVHFSGMTATKDILTDKDFAVTVENSLSLDRKVEMYQWIEDKKTTTEKKAGGKTVTHTSYSYRKDWASTAINSGSFNQQQGHSNPGPLPYQANEVTAENVTLGAHKIPGRDASHLGNAVPVELDSTKITAPVSAIVSGNRILFNVFKEGKAKQAKQMFEASQNGGQVVETASADVASNTALNNAASSTFKAFEYQPNESAPEIGDVRITFTNHPVCEATVVAVQSGDTIKAFETKNGNFYEIRTGIKTAEEVFTDTEKENALITWLLRGLGFFLMAVGFGLIFKPISVLADVLPILGDIAESGISIVSGLLAFVISLTVIAIAWLFYRPVLACCLLLLMAAGIFGIMKLINSVRSAREAKKTQFASETTSESAA